MNKKTFLFFIIFLVILSGCGPSREKSVQRISNLEKNLFSASSMNIDRKKADSLFIMYEKFVKRYPKDTLAPKYIFQSASLAMTLGEGQKALNLMEEFLKKFPENPKAPVCLFFKGYIYENLLTNLDKAKEAYLLFIEKYPSNEFAKDARAAIMNLGKTPDQLVREFEEKQKLENARVADSIAAVNPKKSKRGKK